MNDDMMQSWCTLTWGNHKAIQQIIMYSYTKQPQSNPAPMCQNMYCMLLVHIKELLLVNFTLLYDSRYSGNGLYTKNNTRIIRYMPTG